MRLGCSATRANERLDSGNSSSKISPWSLLTNLKSLIPSGATKSPHYCEIEYLVGSLQCKAQARGSTQTAATCERARGDWRLSWQIDYASTLDFYSDMVWLFPYPLRFLFKTSKNCETRVFTVVEVRESWATPAGRSDVMHLKIPRPYNMIGKLKKWNFCGTSVSVMSIGELLP